jgi:metal-responsive CopG/Arc/MetJ family transcriptional regulator
MSKKQTRRSISVSGEIYDRLQEYVKAQGKTGSGVVEDMLRAFFEMPERVQKEVIAPIPRFERKPPTPRVERVMVMTTPELKPEAAWVEKGPADRVQVIRDMTEAKVAFEKKPEVKPEKKEGVILGDMASKIFTF